MSKRSYRRLAVVAGATLAIGTMAPAMAARVDASGSGSMSVDSIGVTDVTNALPAVNLPIGTVTTLAGSLIGTATVTAPGMVLNDVHTLVGDALGLTTGVLSTGLSAGATGVLSAGLGGATLNVAGVVAAPLNVLGAVGSSNILPDSLGTVTGLAGLAMPTVSTVTNLATSTAFGAVSTVTNLPGTLPNLTGILSAVLGTSASANVGLLAGVGGIF